MTENDHAESKKDVIYDITDGSWRVTAESIDVGNAHIQFYFEGELYREFDYPAYKVWNISAHLPDIIADFGHGIAVASSTGLEGISPTSSEEEQ